MRRFIFTLFARILGVYLVKIKPAYHHHSELAVGMKKPLNRLIQDVAVLFPHRFSSLLNAPIINGIETRVIGHRGFRNEYITYLDAIYRAAKKIKENTKKK